MGSKHVRRREIYGSKWGMKREVSKQKLLTIVESNLELGVIKVGKIYPGGKHYDAKINCIVVGNRKGYNNNTSIGRNRLGFTPVGSQYALEPNLCVKPIPRNQN